MTRNTEIMVAAMLAAFLMATDRVEGQSITLTAPASNITVPAGDDYAVDVIGNPWNMDRLRDIAYDVNYGQPNATNGIWSTSNLNATCYFFPLSPGFLDPDPRYPFYATYYTEGTPYGPLNPIAGAKYRRLSFRMSMQQSARSWIHIGWSTDPNVWPSSMSPLDKIGRFWFGDQEPTFTSGGQPTTIKNPSGWRMYDVDLSGATWTNERIPWLTLGCSTYARLWGDTIYGLMLLPSSDPLPSGQKIQIDWIRLYDPATSPQLDITWQTSDIAWNHWHSIRLFVDGDNSGFDGDLLQTGIANDGRYTLFTGALPAGDYYVYLQVVRHENSGFHVVATSGYSGRIRVGVTPVIDIQAPSYTSGVDYATFELDNPWDFNSGDDVAGMNQIASIQYVGGVMDAVAQVVSGVSDSQLILNMQKNGRGVPINTAKYRYLTFRMKADITSSVNMVDRAEKGWEIKLTWWNQSLSKDGTYTRGVNLLEDWRSYSIDLWDRRFINMRYPYTNGWSSQPQVSRLRFDPLQTPISAKFWLDDIKLCAQNIPTNGSYTIQWNVKDADSSVLMVKVYYGYYTVLGCQEYPTPLYEGAQPPGPGSFVWDMRQIPNDSYFLRAEVSDGVNKSEQLSKVPIVVTGSWPRMNINGWDPTVFNGAQGGYWKILHATGGVATANWGWSSVETVHGDFNGDGCDDLAVFDQSSGRWFIETASKQLIAWSIDWGWSGVRPVPGDYNGDGVDDLAVFDRNTGRWFVRELNGNILAWNINWGWPSVDPVSGDYDGDGRSDLAIFDQASGRWFIRKLTGEIIAWQVFWGWPGVRPVPGDYDGDRIDDLAIYDLNTGRWFIRNVTGDIIQWEDYWGFKGAIPVPGDYDNDDIADQVVYFESTGTWYFKFTSGGTDAAGPWGGPGFKPACGNYDGQ